MMLRSYRAVVRTRASFFPLKFPAHIPARQLACFPSSGVGKQTSRLMARPNTHAISPICQSRFHPTQNSILLVLSVRNTSKLTRDRKQEEDLRNQPYSKGSDPNVSTTSSVTPILGGKVVNTPKTSNDDIDMLKGIKNDLHTVTETFALRDVPREPLYFGLAGVIPYVVTSFSTLYLAWDINHAQIHGMGYLFSEEVATHLLHLLEPLQIGYGAVILSFLGAIHWGLEFAEYGGKYNRRYLVGLISTALAWSTTLLPLHSGLLTQFAGFTGMYFFDSTATTAGYAPPWYTTYRFVLTFIVGAAIVITLVGRGQIGDFSSHSPSPADRLKRLRDAQRYSEEKEREDILRAKQIEERKRIEEEADSKNPSIGKDTNDSDSDSDSGGSKEKDGSKSNSGEDKPTRQGKPGGGNPEESAEGGQGK